MTCPCCACAERTRPAAPTGLREPLFATEDMARFSPSQRDAARRIEAEEVRALAHHEAGHALAALATGWGLRHVTTESADPHALLPERPICARVPALFRVLTVYAAGPIAEGIARRVVRRPSSDELSATLERVRQCGPGTCDDCRAAQVLLIPMILPDDESRVAVWIRCWDAAHAFFDRVEVRIALFRVTVALERDVVLTGAEVETLIDVEGLRAAIEATIAAAAEPELLSRTEGTST